MKRGISRLLITLLALLTGLGVCALTASAKDPGPVTYPLWIGEVQLNENNKDMIAFGEGFARYFPETNTLIFNNVSKKNEKINGDKDPSVHDPNYFLKYDGADNLNIELVGDNYFDCQNAFCSTYSTLVFKGTGSLTANCIKSGKGFFATGELIIEEGCTVNICVKEGAGFDAISGFTCNGTATVTGGTDLLTEGVVSAGTVLITGSFSTEEISSYAIHAEGAYGNVEITGGNVSVNGILVEYGSLTISEGSTVESNARYIEVSGAYNPICGICSGQNIAITDSTVTATSDMTDAIHCEDPTYNTAIISIENSTVVAKSIPKAEETACPGKGIFSKDGMITITDSDVTAEGAEGIYTEWGKITLTKSSVSADGKGTSSNLYGCGIYVGNGDLTAFDTTLTVNGQRAGILVSSGSYNQYYGELVCKGGMEVLREVRFMEIIDMESELKATIEAAEGADCAIKAEGLNIYTGTVSVKGGDYGVIISSANPTYEGLIVGGDITKVVIEGAIQAAILNYDDADKIISLGDELVIREPENGKVSGDKHDFLDADDEVAQKVVLVKVFWIIFDENGGDGAMEAASADSGTEYELPECGFTAPEWHVFDCWLIGDNEYDPGDKIVLTADTIIKAQWKHVHSLSLVNEQAKTCTENGHTAYYTCAGCDLWFEDAEGKTEITDKSSVVIPYGHTEVVDPAVPATCADAGLTEGKHCSACSTVLVAQQTIPPIGHEWGEWVVTKEATEKEAGEETRSCKNNPAHKETREIPKLPHVHSLKKTEEKKASCTEDGNIEYWTCSGCDLWFADKDAKTEITDKSSVVIHAAGHTEVTDDEIAATCTEDGLTEGKHCSACGTVLVAQQTVPALGHAWGAWEVTTEATVEKEGEETRLCERDAAHKETRAIPKISVEYFLVSGEDSEYTPGSEEGLKFAVDCSVAEENPVSHFTGAKTDGEEMVSGKDFIVDAENSVIELKPEFLDKLSPGRHVLSIELNNAAEINANFTVAEIGQGQDGPSTDDSDLPLWISLLAVSLVAITSLVVIRKREKI